MTALAVTQELLSCESRSSIEDWCQRNAQSLYLGDRVLCRVLGKYLMYALSTDRSLTPHLALDGYWEMWITMAIARFIRPGMVCIDVGANVGYYSVLMGDWVGPTGRVIAIEPDPHNCHMLQANLERVPSAAMMCEAAASSSEGTAELNRSLTHAGDHTLERVSFAGHATTTVRTLTLDSVVAGKVDFIKIDVEGHERSVWRGAERILRDNPQLQLAVEWTPARDPECEFGAMAEQAGFTLQEIHTDGSLRPVAREALVQPGGDWRMLWLSRKVSS